MADTANACPACGKAAAQSVGGGAAAQPAQQNTTGVADNILGLLCYSPVGLFADIFYLVAEPYNRNKFLRFHAFQSLFLGVGCFVLGFGLTIVSTMLGAVAGPLALIMVPIDMLIWLGILCLWVFMMVKAYGMNMTKLPVIGDLAAKQAGA
jgi:uncharacterized membrane protein